MSTIKDKNLAVVGQQEVDWAARQMKFLKKLKQISQIISH